MRNISLKESIYDEAPPAISDPLSLNNHQSIIDKTNKNMVNKNSHKNNIVIPLDNPYIYSDIKINISEQGLNSLKKDDLIHLIQLIKDNCHIKIDKDKIKKYNDNLFQMKKRINRDEYFLSIKNDNANIIQLKEDYDKYQKIVTKENETKNRRNKIINKDFVYYPQKYYQKYDSNSSTYHKKYFKLTGKKRKYN